MNTFLCENCGKNEADIWSADNHAICQECWDERFDK